MKPMLHAAYRGAARCYKPVCTRVDDLGVGVTQRDSIPLGSLVQYLASR